MLAFTRGVERCEFTHCVGSGVVRQSDGPYHSPYISTSIAVGLSALPYLLEYVSSHRGDVGVGIADKQLFESGLKLIIILFAEIGKLVEEHKLRHNRR